MEKKDYKHGKFLILTTSTDGFEYADYVEWCEANDRKPCGEDSGDFECWKEDEAQTNYESDMDNITSCSKYCVNVRITGELGLWDGKHTITPVKCSTVAEAIKKCISGCDDCNVWFNDGAIEVEGYHHDGTNRFMIHAIDDRGREKRLPYLYTI